MRTAVFDIPSSCEKPFPGCTLAEVDAGTDKCAAANLTATHDVSYHHFLSVTHVADSRQPK